MKPQTTEELFEHVIHTRGVYQDLGITEMAVKNLRRNYKAGKVSIDKMHEVLRRAGYQIVQETKWGQPEDVKVNPFDHELVHHLQILDKYYGAPNSIPEGIDAKQYITKVRNQIRRKFSGQFKPSEKSKE